ncbi:LysR family transcriptional regulator [Pigmentiphaga soli]|uniref:LysR family transcriptional regulator n=1 Tax=Pigmentiphaga soli TaxID=1007095 RepID=A0ABP8HRN0_9BURK
MKNRLPPLNSLKVFEAAARHSSFKKAAEELHVTAAAVSHQLSQLESILGVQLFRRFNQGIELTPAARMCLPRLREGLECLRDSVEQIRVHARAEVLTVAAAPSFAMRWLMPRLHRFILARPDIDVHVATRMSPFQGRRGARSGVAAVHEWAAEADLILMYGHGDYPGLHVAPLLGVSVTPLCSPTLLRRQPLDSAEQLLNHTLLHDDREALYGNPSFWQRWLEGAGVTGIAADRGPRFTHAFLAAGAALEGLGVVATTPALVTEELETGRLVAPLGTMVRVNAGYHAVTTEKSERRDDVQAFKAWLLEEAAATEACIRRAIGGRRRRGAVHRAFAAADGAASTERRPAAA